MQKLSLVIVAAALFAVITPAHAAGWETELQNAVAQGKYGEINVIAANNPDAQGQIAMYLLNQSQHNLDSNKTDTAIKLFDAAAPFAEQISLGDAPYAGKIVDAMVDMASDPEFQQKHARDASDIFTAALAISSASDVVVANPNLHNHVLADASEFMDNNPVDPDKRLRDQVDLALQVGSPPPLGPHGVINPSAE